MALELTKNQRRVLEWLGCFKGKNYHYPEKRSYQFTSEVTDSLVKEGLIEGDGKGGFRKVGKVKKAIKGRK